jgi:hypothetical protein
MGTVTGKSVVKATVGAVLVHPDGTRYDLGLIAGARTPWEKMRAKWLRRKMLMAERRRNG